MIIAEELMRCRPEAENKFIEQAMFLICLQTIFTSIRNQEVKDQMNSALCVYLSGR